MAAHCNWPALRPRACPIRPGWCCRRMRTRRRHPPSRAASNCNSMPAPPSPTTLSTPPPPPPIAGGVQLQFDAGPPLRYDVLDRRTTPPTTVATAQPYVSGAPIAIDGWELRLQGAPNTGDTVLIGNALDPQYGDRFSRDTGNASALMDLRDLKMFDESTLSDGYAQAIAQVGTRTQSAKFAADLSRT